ncbi:aspartate/glutamate racemase family protein [Sphingomonas montanisoli]|uniref:Hydantoin racemase n=1 Tax=Sphingomonas montanisoli TaxID=2606412 RepID=A0A5D9C1Z2_9SPHN|nr:aspartate/glutamate racemase family protein [Sphingomonas montanisoli]TZG25666.1 hydantoin racemase [Sphingomonas montanisoli]
MYDPCEQPIRVRWLRPIGLTTFDEPIARLLSDIRLPGTEVEVASFDMPFSPPHLEYRAYEALMGDRIVATARDAGQNGIDAMVIGCFYDCFLEDARELSGNAIIIAPCEACLTVASALANRFSIIVGRDKWIEQMRNTVERYGMGSRLASFRSLGMNVPEFQKDHAFTRKRIIEEARRAVEEDRAEAIVLGCTLEFGFYAEVQKEIGVPVIDAVIAPFKHAEHLARLKRQFGWQPSRAWSCEAPSEEEMRSFGLFQTQPKLNRTVI